MIGRMRVLSSLKVVAAFRRGIESRSDRYVIPSTVADLHEARRAGRIAVANIRAVPLPRADPVEGDTGALTRLWR